MYLGSEGLSVSYAHTIKLYATNTISIGVSGATPTYVDIYAGSSFVCYVNSNTVISITTSSASFEIGNGNAIIYGTTTATTIYVNGTSYISMGSSAITVSYATTFSGTVTFSTHAYWGASDRAYFGAGNELSIYNDGTYSYFTSSDVVRIYAGASTLEIGYSSSYKYFTGNFDGTRYYAAMYYNNSIDLVCYTSGLTCYRNVIPQSADTKQCGSSTLYWSNVSSKVFEDVADWPLLDSRKEGSITVPIDDIETIKSIRGSGLYDDSTGMEIIDDNTLPGWLLSKHDRDWTEELDGEMGEIIKINHKKGDTKYTLDGKPFLSLHTMISLCMGAIRQLDAKIEELKTLQGGN